LEAELEALRRVAVEVSDSVHSRGPTTVDRLRDVPVRIWQIAGRGVRKGAATVLAVVQEEVGQYFGALEPEIPEEGDARALGWIPTRLWRASSSQRTPSATPSTSATSSSIPMLLIIRL
jgi:hypothetical protein